VQENRLAREPNHEHSGMPEALCLDPKRKVSSQPMDEDGHSCTLYGERQGTEDDGRKSLAEKFHRSRQLRRRRLCREKLSLVKASRSFNDKTFQQATFQSSGRLPHKSWGTAPVHLLLLIAIWRRTTLLGRCPARHNGVKCHESVTCRSWKAIEWLMAVSMWKEK
jgi:hypothetical protein